MKLIDANLPALEAKFADEDKADRIYFDPELHGFGLRFRKGGKRTWVLQYKYHGMDKRLSLGSLAEINAKAARNRAKDKLAEIWKGIDPQQVKRDARAKAQLDAKQTLGAVIDSFLAAKKEGSGSKKKKLRPRSFSELQRYVLGDWKSLHRYPISSITRKQVAAILDELEKRGPVAAARSRSALSTVFVWAMERGHVDQNAVVGTANPDTNATRDRVLTNTELAAVWNAAGGDDYGAIIKLLILTGARRTEIGGMMWQELNLEDRTWTIPASRAKNDNSHLLPLPQMCWSIIGSVEHRPGTDHLFGYSSQGFCNWDAAKKNLDQRCGIAPWTHHDLRRTVATKMAESPPEGLGVKPHVIEAVLNHISGHKAGIAGIYNRASYKTEVRNALAIWADHIRKITTGVEPTVIPMRREIPA
jgi:integrase